MEYTKAKFVAFFRTLLPFVTQQGASFRYKCTCMVNLLTFVMNKALYSIINKLYKLLNYTNVRYRLIFEHLYNSKLLARRVILLSLMCMIVISALK